MFRPRTAFQPHVLVQRGITMSPRIQVYKAVACRSLNQDGGRPGLGFLGPPSTLVDCTSSEVQARAARIQACQEFSSYSILKVAHLHLRRSGYDVDEHFECNLDWFLESPW